MAFEFSFGHFVAGHSWSRLFQDYNLFAGRLWVLVLLWLTLAPYLFYWRKNSNQNASDPRQIILFGSQARGSAKFVILKMNILLTFTGFHDPYALGLMGGEEVPGPVLSLRG